MAPLTAFTLSQDIKDSTRNVQQILTLTFINLLEENLIIDSNIETYDGVSTSSKRYALGGQDGTSITLSSNIH